METARILSRLGGVALVAAGLLAAACGGGASSPADRAETDQGLAFDFTLQDVHGSTVRLADSAGQIRLLDFWATWCAPCREEIPMLKEFYRTYGPQGFTVLAISDENPKIIREFVEKNEIPYANLIDPGETSEKYGVISLPSAYLVDGEGRIVEEFRGTKPRKVLEARIRELLDLPPLT